MNKIFSSYNFIIVYIDDVLIFSENIDQHFKHLNIFYKYFYKNGIVISSKKFLTFQTKIRFLGYNLENGQTIPINRSIDFASKFSDEIKDIKQLQRFLGSLNYIRGYYKKSSN